MKHRILYLTLITATLIVLVGLFRPEPMNSKTGESFFWNNKVNDDSKYNFIIIGDSRAYRGLSPNEIEKKLDNYKAKNLGFSSGGFNSHVFELVDKYFDTTVKENVILICLTPFSLTKSAYESNQLVTLKKKKGFENWQINNVTKNLSFFDPIIPSEVGANFMGYGYYHIYHENGWVESEKYPIDRDISLKLYSKEFANNKFCNECFEVLLNNINSLTSKNVKVFILRIPIYKELKILEDSISGFNEKMIKSRIISEGGKWLDVDESLYETYDGSHLDSKSARLLSINIAKKINSQLANEEKNILN